MYKANKQCKYTEEKITELYRNSDNFADCHISFQIQCKQANAMYKYTDFHDSKAAAKTFYF